MVAESDNDELQPPPPPPPPPQHLEKLCECYTDKLNAWTFITELGKDRQAIAGALFFPENGDSQIWDKVFSQINIDDSKKEDSTKTLIRFMDVAFEKDELT